jgi:hypothetical protein
VSTKNEEVSMSSGEARVAQANQRGAVTAEKAILTVLVIAFAWAGIHFLGDPMRDQVFRVVFVICDRIYQMIASVVFR